MKAVVFTGPKQVVIEDRPMPGIEKETDVLIRVDSVGICGSDIHNLLNSMGNMKYPMVPCHEFVGTVDQIGSGVTRYRVGDRVCVEPIKYCGKCYACRNGRQNVCTSVVTAGSHFDGGMCEYFLTTEDKLYAIPEELTFHQAVLTEPYTIGVQVNARAQTAPGDIVLIHGGGPIGLIVMDVARKIGAKVIISEIKEGRLQMAKEMGADWVINPMQQDLKAEVARITGGMGPNIIIDAAGLPGMLTEAADMVSPAGSIVSMCFQFKEVKMDILKLILKETNLVGSRLQNDKFPVVLGQYADRLAANENILITDTFPAEKAVEAFELAISGKDTVGKIVVTF